MLRCLALVPLAVLVLALALLVAGAGSAITSVVLVSVDSAGVEANAPSFSPAVTADGRYVAFASNATDLAGVDPAPAVTDIFVRDLQTGTTERITAGDAASTTPSISDDGRWVTFQSDATDIAPPDTNGQSDVFLYDRDTDTTLRITHGNNDSSSPVVSGDGNFVAFGSFATDIGGGTGVGDVFRWERATGTIVKASVSSTGLAGDDQSSIPDISADGSVVVFNSRATNLVAGDTNSTWDVFVRDLDADTTEAASVSSAEVLAEATFFGSGAVRISGNGRYVSFDSSATNLVPGFGDGVYLRDRIAGTTAYVSAGNGNTGGSGPAPVTDDGHVAFASFAALVPEDTNFRTDVYVASTPERVSVTDTGAQATSASSSDGASHPSISEDGSLIVVQNTFASVISGSTTLPNLVAYTVGTSSGGGFGSGGGGSGGSTPQPASVPTGAPRLALEVSSTVPGDPSGFRPAEPITITITVRNTGDAPAHAVKLSGTMTYILEGGGDEEPAAGVVLAVTPEGCLAFDPGKGEIPTDASLPAILAGSDEPVCDVAAILGPGESSVVRLRVSPRADVVRLDSTFRATSVETSSDFGGVSAFFYGERQERCVEETSCPTSEGDDNRECVDSRCFFSEGNDRGVCAGADAVCSGQEDEDSIVCLRESTCSGGADDDRDICRSGSTCTEDESDDTMDCAGAETSCNAGNGINVIDCKADAVCRDGRGDSELACRDATVDAGRGDHEAEGRNCEWTFGAGDNVLGGSGNRVFLKGGGDLLVRGSVFLDAINGDRNVIQCTGSGRSIVRADPEDDARDCDVVRRFDLVAARVAVAGVGRASGTVAGAAGTGIVISFRVANQGLVAAPAYARISLVDAGGRLVRDLGLVVLEAKSERGDCAVGEGTTSAFVECDFGRLGPRERITGTIRLATAQPGWSLVPTLAVGDLRSVACSAEDEDCGNNSRTGPTVEIAGESSRTGRIDPDRAPDLDVSIVGTPTARAGRFLRYTVRVKNVGSVHADKSRVELSYVDAAGSVGVGTERFSSSDCLSVAGVRILELDAVWSTRARCDFDSIAPGETRTIEVQIGGGQLVEIPNESRAGRLSLVVEAHTSCVCNEANLANNDDEATTVVLRRR